MVERIEESQDIFAINHLEAFCVPMIAPRSRTELVYEAAAAIRRLCKN